MKKRHLARVEVRLTWFVSSCVFLERRKKDTREVLKWAVKKIAGWRRVKRESGIFNLWVGNPTRSFLLIYLFYCLRRQPLLLSLLLPPVLFSFSFLILVSTTKTIQGRPKNKIRNQIGLSLASPISSIICICYGPIEAR